MTIEDKLTNMDIGNYKELINRLIEEIKDKSLKCFGDRLVSLVVFGSVAKGLNTPESDVDILYLLEDYKGNYEEFMSYFNCVEENLEILKSMKEAGINTFISPIFMDINHISVRMPIFWDTDFIILYDKEGFFSNFIEELKDFKKKKLTFFERPMPYFKVLD